MGAESCRPAPACDDARLFPPPAASPLLSLARDVVVSFADPLFPLGPKAPCTTEDSLPPLAISRSPPTSVTSAGTAEADSSSSSQQFSSAESKSDVSDRSINYFLPFRNVPDAECQLLSATHASLLAGFSIIL